ncbi:hypothetical protein BGW36DRAFT_426720 [Talaromyces proteolyticus]|uniref:Uncharacterized protein n=1 Tax=Talaromyces proteolyticus TaxID=1131652 RepID=A0AAD4KV69_9EURO|nr:uncharacterized protein BGW36DRAFT_426720 [Talaromyces proteolyticus]KAH8699039.1 hypothetical protein BGW36DRAFT_426720 [Talaromyces proteolyticus]
MSTTRGQGSKKSSEKMSKTLSPSPPRSNAPSKTSGRKKKRGFKKKRNPTVHAELQKAHESQPSKPSEEQPQIPDESSSVAPAQVDAKPVAEVALKRYPQFGNLAYELYLRPPYSYSQWTTVYSPPNAGSSSVSMQKNAKSPSRSSGPRIHPQFGSLDFDLHVRPPSAIIQSELPSESSMPKVVDSSLKNDNMPEVSNLEDNTYPTVEAQQGDEHWQSEQYTPTTEPPPYDHGGYSGYPDYEEYGYNSYKHEHYDYESQEHTWQWNDYYHWPQYGQPYQNYMYTYPAPSLVYWNQFPVNGAPYYGHSSQQSYSSRTSRISTLSALASEFRPRIQKS